MNRIQTSHQMIVEHHEKIRILENDVEALRFELEQVDATVTLHKKRATTGFETVRPDAIRFETGRVT
jgi:hypothetical protein